MEQPDIEKEVKRLFRADSEAISVKWELITEDDLKGGAEKGDIAGGAGGSGPYNRTDTGASLDIGKQSITLVGEPECINQTIHYLPILNPCNNYHLHRAVFSSLLKYFLYKLVNYW